MTKLTAVYYAVLLTTVSSAPVAWAQKPLNTATQAVERAVLQSPDVKLRFHNFEAARFEQKSAEGAWLPRIDMEVAGGSYMTNTPSRPTDFNYNGNRATIQLRQTLFDGFATLHETRRLSYAQQAAYYDLLSASNQTALDAVRAYLDVLRYRDLVQLAADNFSTHLEVHDRISQKVKAGVGRKVDLEQAAGRLALAESNWLTETSNLHDVSARYQRLTGEVPAADLQPVESIGTAQPPKMGKDAIRSNPDFLSAVATVRGYRSDSKSRRSGYYPTLELRARQSYETNQSGILGDYRDTALELVLNYNLFRGGSDKARVNQYVAKLASAYDLRDKACRDVWQTGEIAYNDSQRIAAQITLLNQHELSTSKALQAYKQQFEIGQRSLLDLLDTENELYQARRALTNADYDQKLAQARVLASSGALLNALKLRALADETPDASGNTEDDDDLMQCDSQAPVTPALDRTIMSRTSTLPAEGAVPSTPPAPAVAAAVPVAAPGADCSQLPKAVEQWLGAWNRKELPAYLGAYSEKFTPANGLDRKQWEALRKSRVTQQGDIKVSMANLTTVRCEKDSAEVKFTQTYGSKTYSDTVEKSLQFEAAKGAWKITRETVTKGRTN
ncbi:MAG: TolC family outer membrane protein [Rhodoferax sp.]